MNEKKETARTFEEIQGAVTELENLKARYGVRHIEGSTICENDIAKEVLYVLAKYNTTAAGAIRILERAKELATGYAVLITQ